MKGLEIDLFDLLVLRHSHDDLGVRVVHAKVQVIAGHRQRFPGASRPANNFQRVKVPKKSGLIRKRLDVEYLFEKLYFVNRERRELAVLCHFLVYAVKSCFLPLLHSQASPAKPGPCQSDDHQSR